MDVKTEKPRAELRPLAVIIRQGEAVIGRVEIPDPREQFIRSYNELNRARGRRAELEEDK